MKVITLLIGFVLSLIAYFLLASPAPKQMQRGVSWVAGRTIDKNDFEPLRKNHVNWIVQTPFGWQAAYNQPEIKLATGNTYLWGESDEGLIETKRLADQYQIKTLLKPHIWLRGRDGKWRADIAMQSEADWDSWFASYQTFILHYAKLAEKQQMPILSIGTELHQTVKLYPKKWRSIIKEIRVVYSGQLTYSANWYQEYQDVEFWDDLDYIGIQAYFPLSETEHNDKKSLKKAWQSHLEEIEKLQSKFNKPVLFTEIGYKSTSNTAIEPWVWPQHQRDELIVDENLQKICYEAFFEVFWHKTWFKGVYFWKWYPHHDKIQSHRFYDIDFTPQHKPAEAVIREWFAK